jgi:hypothetical protein
MSRRPCRNSGEISPTHGSPNQVEVIQARAPDVSWQEPIALLLIDGLHDHASVARDFHCFEPWLAEGAYVAFHDYAGYFPGVMAFVDELLVAGAYRKVQVAGSMFVLRQRGGVPQAPGAEAPARLPAFVVR